MNENALQPAFDAPPGMSAAERINYHHQHAERHFSDGMAHALQCGWELSRQKSIIGWGRWKKWVKANLSFSLDRADRLIELYDAKIGAERERVGIAPENPISKAEIDSVLGRTAGQSVTAVMIGEGIIAKRAAKWGGAREGAGRKTTSALPKLSPDECRSEALHAIGPHLDALHDALARGGDADFLSLADLQDLETALRALVQRAADRIAAKLPSRS